jgi:hypothetical protein
MLLKSGWEIQLLQNLISLINISLCLVHYNNIYELLNKEKNTFSINI